MSPKAKEAAKKAAVEKKSEKEAPAKDGKKAAKSAAPVDEVELERMREGAASDEEEADADEESADSGGGGNAAALAAAAGGGEMSASFKNFRHHPDMENFYRFIYENDLRYEALAIIDEILSEKQSKKLGKAPAPGKQTHA